MIQRRGRILIGKLPRRTGMIGKVPYLDAEAAR